MSIKQEVISDEYSFQRACSNFINGKVIYCVSSLMSDIGRNLEKSARIFDFDYEEALNWFTTPPDLEEALCQNNIKVFEVDGTWYWSDERNLTWDKVDDLLCIYNEEPTLDFGRKLRTDFETVEEALAFLNEHVLVKNFDSMVMSATEEEAMQEACEVNHIDADDYRREVYEHWLVCSHFGARLRERGETVFEFANMTIWGRTTTGQSISMDGVIHNMVRDLDEDHYIWSES